MTMYIPIAGTPIVYRVAHSFCRGGAPTAFPSRPPATGPPFLPQERPAEVTSDVRDPTRIDVPLFLN